MAAATREAVTEFAVLAEHLKKRLPQYPVEFGYLEFATPIIRDGLDKLRAGGVTRVLAVPGMLFAAGHAKNDIPSVLNTYAAQNDLTINYGKELGIDPKMLRAAGDRIQQALTAAGDHISKHETLLVVVGRGASDPDANSNVSKVMRMLWEGFGFGWGEVAYSGVTFPLVEPALEHCTRLGFKRIIVFPYFLFTGILVHRIYDATDDGGCPPPRRRIRQGPLPQRSSGGDRHLCRAHRTDPDRRHCHELPALQVPHAGAGLRGGSGRRAGEPSSPCRRHWLKTANSADGPLRAVPRGLQSAIQCIMAMIP